MAGPETDTETHRQIESIYRAESRRVFATLVRLLGDFDLAEEALHDAFASAMDQWPKQGRPDNPRAWLVSAGRFKGIDAIRRRARHDAMLAGMAEEMNGRTAEDPADRDPDAIEDDRLRLIFTCCHPALPAEARTALTLREVCELTTEEIARAFLAAPATIAQRIVRAKSKIKNARIPYQVPSRADLPERLDTVLHVIYLVFNEGYAASSGESLTRADLSGEAIRLARLMRELLPEPEVLGLLALLLLQESRRPARSSPGGEIILLEDQDRSLWDRKLIDEGLSLVNESLNTQRVGPYAIQAAIAAVHAQAPTADHTDWAQIAGLYGVLFRMEPSPIIELNRAVAIAMHEGPAVGLGLIDAILERGELADYHLAHSAKAELCRRLGQFNDAKSAYERALGLVTQEPERRFLMRRLGELSRKITNFKSEI